MDHSTMIRATLIAFISCLSGLIVASSSEVWILEQWLSVAFTIVIVSVFWMAIRSSETRITDLDVPLMCKPWDPSMPIPILPPGRTVVLLLRHGPKDLGPGKDKLTSDGIHKTVELSESLRRAGVTIRACFTSKLYRCYQTAKSICDFCDSVLATAQILGGDGPFVQDDVVSQATFKCAIELNPVIDHNHPVMQRIVHDKPVDGYHRRTLAVARIGSGLEALLKGSGPSSAFHIRPDGLVVAVSHDMIIAGVMLELGLPCPRWPDYLSGVIVDLELLKNPQLVQKSHSPSSTNLAFASTLSDEKFGSIEATKQLPESLSESRATLAIHAPTYRMQRTNKPFDVNSVEYHDHGMVLMRGGRVIACLELERLTRKKHDNNLDAHIHTLLDTFVSDHGLRVDEVDIVYVESFGPDAAEFSSSDGQFVISAGPTTRTTADEHGAFAAVAQLQELDCAWDEYGVPACLLSHELAHVYSTLAFEGGSVPDNTLMVHFDGAASKGNFSAWIHTQQGGLKLLECDWSMSQFPKFFNCNGLAFAIINAQPSDHLSAPGKIMGLAAHGKVKDTVLVFLRNNNFFHGCWSDAERTAFQTKAMECCGWQPGKYEDGRVFSTRDPFLQDCLAAMQHAFTTALIERLTALQLTTGAEALFYAGGCALNIVATAAIERSGLFRYVAVPPCCSDSGLALGAATFVEALKHGSVHKHGPYLHNVGISDASSLSSAPIDDAEIEDTSDVTTTAHRAATMLAKGKVVGVINGFAEIGPRALGNRSLLALPTEALRHRLSEKMKGREWYRPVAPVMLLKNAIKVTGMDADAFPVRTSRFMLTNLLVLKEYRDALEGVVHADGTARIQVVCQRDENPFLFDLLTFLDTEHGKIALINTSFNRRGEPLVHTHHEAMNAAVSMEADAMVVEHRLIFPRPRLRILVSNHGYPPINNAGSEIYTQTLANALHDAGHDVVVFSRYENMFDADYKVKMVHDSLNPAIKVYLMNHARSNARFANSAVDDAWRGVLLDVKPDIVHFGHLNHLSTGMVQVAKALQIKTVFTLHDFWLACPRGQFLQWGLSDREPFSLCSGQSDAKCAEKCLNRFSTGSADMQRADKQYWEAWVANRMESTRAVCRDVDVFIAPSQYMCDRMTAELPVLANKTLVHDYGFNLSYLPRRPVGFRAIPKLDGVVFGYTGRHHPSKGVEMLIESFYRIPGSDSLLRIWGRNEGQLTASLRETEAKCRAQADARGDRQGKRVEWFAEYTNREVFDAVFMQCDVLVVPSVWAENSPLVIHEAQQCGVPIVTANKGGMSEFVHDGVNGLLFEHRNNASLTAALTKVVADPAVMATLGQRRYIKSKSGDIMSIAEDVRFLVAEYDRLLDFHPLPWRITFDTNITVCNLSCTMCEGFSPYKDKELVKQESKSKRIMPFPLLEKTVRECVTSGTALREVIPTMMGEPLMYKEFPDILNLCEEHNLKLNLTTNGTWYRKGPVAWGELILPVASDIKISWNGATAETNEKVMTGVEGKWSNRFPKLKEFLDVRETMPDCKATVTLQVTFMEQNAHEFPALVKMAAELGVDRVKGHQLWVTYAELADQNMRRSPASRRRWNAIVDECRRVAQCTPMVASTRHDPAVARFVKLENFNHIEVEAVDGSAVPADWICPFLGKEAWVSPEGTFSPCCAPAEDRKTLGDFGSIKDRSIAEIFASPEYRKLVRHYKTDYKLCGTCSLRRPAPAATPPHEKCPAPTDGNRRAHVDVAFEGATTDVPEWQATRVSDTGDHHVYKDNGAPVYDARFLSVYSFHAPGGVAAVRDCSDTAYHIGMDGKSIYPDARRFSEAYGFYEALAAVVDSNGRAFHVNIQGERAYTHNWKWCGNFQHGRCTVRDTSGLYYYIDHSGLVLGGPYLYAGDAASDGTSIVRRLADGRCQYLDTSCSVMSKASFLSVGPFHKRIAVVSDTQGKHHVHFDDVMTDAASDTVTSVSDSVQESVTDADAASIGTTGAAGDAYEELEPFYNRYAFFRRNDGAIGLIDERTGAVETISRRVSVQDSLVSMPSCDGITVVTPTSAATQSERATLQRAMDSVALQRQNCTVPVHHLIVAQDATADIRAIQQLTSSAASVRVVSVLRLCDDASAGGGTGAASLDTTASTCSRLRNIGVALANTSHVAFLDDNNTFLKEHLASMLAVLTAAENATTAPADIGAYSSSIADESDRQSSALVKSHCLLRRCACISVPWPAVSYAQEWQHVDDHCAWLDDLAEQHVHLLPTSGATLVIGGGSGATNATTIKSDNGGACEGGVKDIEDL
eukprot:m.1634234 g.1634234  ORF g.1634234 m.1634234 type:complete len:2281 (-) comp25413_c0_seq5:6626-13468(-)